MSQKKNNTIVIIGIIIIVVLVGIIVFLPKEQKTEDQPTAQKQTFSQFPAPHLKVDETLGNANYNWEFKTADGKTTLLSDYKGKTIFINLWATWCGPCLAEMPTVQQLYSEMKDEVVFLVISNEDLPTVSGFANSGKYDLPFISAEGEMPPSFAVDVIPTTFIINKAGKIVVKHSGAVNWADESVKTFLKNL